MTTPIMSGVREHFTDADDCRRMICEARQNWGDPSLWEGIERALSFIYLYCEDEEVQEQAYAHLQELEARKFKMLSLGKATAAQCARGLR